MATTSGENVIPVQFAQKLASNEKKIRDRAIKKLRTYITARSKSPNNPFTREDLLKIWKGLFYCLWMCDKPLVQEDLIDILANLLHAFQTNESALIFADVFFETIGREWFGLDRLRLDKFYLLIRVFLNQSFEFLKRNKWEANLLNKYVHILQEGPLNPARDAVPDGVTLHLAEIYLTELERVGAIELSPEETLKFLQPFSRLAGETPKSSLVNGVLKSVFQLIVDRSDVGLKSESDEEDSGEEAENQENLEESDTGSQPGDSDGPDEENLGEQSGYSREAAKPQLVEKIKVEKLKFDYGAVADQMFAYASKKKVLAKNRKKIYNMINKFKDLSEGVYPEADKYYYAYEYANSVKAKNSKKNHIKDNDGNDDEEEEDEEEEQQEEEHPVLKKKISLKQVASQKKIEASDLSNQKTPSQFNGAGKKGAKKRKLGQAQRGEIPEMDAPPNRKTKVQPSTTSNGNLERKEKKKKSSTWSGDAESGDGLEDTVPKQLKKLTNKKSQARMPDKQSSGSHHPKATDTAAMDPTSPKADGQNVKVVSTKKRKAAGEKALTASQKKAKFNLQTQPEKPASQKKAKFQLQAQLEAPASKKKRLQAQPETPTSQKKAKSSLRAQPEVPTSQKKTKSNLQLEPQTPTSQKKAKSSLRAQPEVPTSQKKAKSILQQEPQTPTSQKKAKSSLRAQPEVPTSQKKAKSNLQQEPQTPTSQKKAKSNPEAQSEVPPSQKKAKSNLQAAQIGASASQKKKAKSRPEDQPQVPTTGEQEISAVKLKSILKKTGQPSSNQPVVTKKKAGAPGTEPKKKRNQALRHPHSAPAAAKKTVTIDLPVPNTRATSKLSNISLGASPNLVHRKRASDFF